MMSTALEDVKKERERFVAFAFAAAEIFLEVDKDGKILFEGGASDRLGAGKSSQLVDSNILDIIDQDDQPIYKALFTHLEHKGRIGPLPLRFMSENNRTIALRVFALSMPGEQGRTFLALRAAPLGGGGISEQSADKETGLLTRDAFMGLAAKTMSDNSQGSNLYMTAVEIEGLDEARKKGGPKHMKQLLKEVAAHLRTLSVDGQAASQISDKHFAFLHRTKTDGEHLSKTLQKVDKNIRLKTSHSTLTADGADVSEDQILRTLTYILNEFCNNPGDVDFDTLTNAYEDMASKAQIRVTNMRSMIETGNFKMAFQPVISLANGDIHHNEVLSRFDENGVGGTPMEIIKFAEDVGIIEEFDIALVHKAVDYVRKMKKLGTPLTLAVNLSGRTLDSEKFAEPLVNALKDAKDVAHSLLLELTETTAVKNFEKVEVMLKELQSCNYKICLDDFGAGAAGYQYLRAFNVDFVKIDGQYVRDMNTPGYRPTFLLSIVRLCSDLGIKTIGEHVENRFQADFLRSLGVDFAQGFHFGKPDFTPRTN
jgi:EAL domain-containing protein (putative c-di-GMP-specific phosphodiesterase class I)